MKIDALKSSQTAPAANRPAARASQDSTAAPADTEVRLSSASATLAAGSSAPVDQARVHEIRQAISEGRFQINAGAIADRLIETARDLVQRQATADR